MKSLHNFMVIMKYQTPILNGSLFISLSQFATIPLKAFWVSFCKEKISELFHSRFYLRLTLNTKISGICIWDFKDCESASREHQ